MRAHASARASSQYGCCSPVSLGAALSTCTCTRASTAPFCAALRISVRVIKSIFLNLSRVASRGRGTGILPVGQSGVSPDISEWAGKMPAGPTAPHNGRIRPVANRTSALQLIDHSLFEPAVRIHAPIAQKWPMRAMLVDAVPFHIGHHNLFLIDRTFRDDLAARPSDKTLSPKLNSVAAGRCFMTDPVRCCDITTIGNRVTALNCFPG